MTSAPESQRHRLQGWKRIAVICFSIGLGLAVGLAVILGVWLWASSRPSPPPKWNDKALVAKGQPTFFGVEDTVVLSYPVRNTTRSDFSIHNADDVRLFMRTIEDSLLVLQNASVRVVTPANVPAMESSLLYLFIGDSKLPRKGASQSDSLYHEAVRDFLNSEYSNVAGYVLYDDVNHYRVFLPRWRDKPTP
jgi:hypothetical protein